MGKKPELSPRQKRNLKRSGLNLVYHRKRRFFSQSDLCDKANIAPHRLREFEMGDRELDKSEIKAITKVLGVDPKMILM